MSKYFLIIPIFTVVLGRDVTVHNRSGLISPDAHKLPKTNTPEKEISFIQADVLCSIIVQNRSIPSLINQYISDEKIILIRYTLNLDLSNATVGKRSDTRMFNPLKWMKTKGRQGTRLLILDFEYELLSLHSLSIGIKDVTVPLKQSPEHCFDSLNVSNAELLLTQIVMDNFQNESTSKENLESPESVCNLHVLSKSGHADFRYRCCQQNLQGQMNCHYLYEDKWVDIKKKGFILIAILTMLVCPFFVPKCLFEDKAHTYVYRSPENVNLMMSVYKGEETSEDRNTIMVFKKSAFEHMSNFWQTISSLDCGVVRKFRILELHLKVKSNRLLGENDSRFGVLNFLYDELIKCKIRDRGVAKQCCKANICCNKCCQCCTWYNVVKCAMELFIILIMFAPWITQLSVYIYLEKPEEIERTDAAQIRNLIYDRGNSFHGFMMKSLSTWWPYVFLIVGIVMCLFFLLIRWSALVSCRSCSLATESCTCNSRFWFERLMHISRFCFLNDHDYSFSKTFNRRLKEALTLCGVGKLSQFLAWPCLLFLWLYGFPTICILVRLIIYLRINLSRLCTCCKNRDQQMEDSNKYIVDPCLSGDSNCKIPYMIAIFFTAFYLFCMLVIYVLLCTQTIVFASEFVFYTLIGLVLNALSTNAYVSISLLLAIYAVDCFGHVSKSFASFNKFMNTVISERAKVNEAQQETSVYGSQNVAYKIGKRQNALDSSIKLIETLDGLPKWTTDGTHFFIDKDDVPYISRSFFFSACKMPFHDVPGGLGSRYVRACIKFGCIAVFLLFIVLIIWALGDAYNISGIYQIFLALSIGTMPKLTQMCVKTHSKVKFKKENIRFQSCLDETLNNFDQSWPICDILVDPNFDNDPVNTDIICTQQHNYADETSPLIKPTYNCIILI